MPSHLRIAMLLLVASTAFAQTGADSPKNALKSLYDAVAKADGERVKQLLVADNDPEQKLVGAFSNLLLSGKTLGKAAKDKFPGVGDAFVQGTLAPEDAQQIDGATETIDGENATIVLKSDQPQIKLRKVSGSWRVVAWEETSPPTKNSVANQIALIQGLADAMSLTAADISAGKFPDAGEAEAALKERLSAVLGRAMQNPTSRPTTRP